MKQVTITALYDEDVLPEMVIESVLMQYNLYDVEIVVEEAP